MTGGKAQYASRTRDASSTVRRSGGRDFDAARLQLRLLRNRHLEHALRVPGADCVEVGAVREREAAQEPATAALQATVGAGLFLGARMALTADGQDAFLSGDL